MIDYRFDLHGGNLTSIQVNGEEMLYQPDPRAWKGQDVVIFPFVARLKDKTYTVNGKEYSMLNHGLARYHDFKLIENNGFLSVLEFDSDSETRKQYPFDFSLIVNYFSHENSLDVTYKATNKGNLDMPFGIGAHPALKIPSTDKENETDISGNKIVFEKELDLDYYAMDEKYEFIDKKVHFGKAKEIQLSKKMFQKTNTLILDAQNINSVTLEKSNGQKVIYRFKTIRYLALWSHPQYGDYICIEPWMSLPDYIDGDKELCKKKSLLSLKPGEEFEFSYSLEFTK